MVTIINASVYSSGGSMVYELEYSEGTKIRAVITAGWLQNETLKGNKWIQTGKRYVVKTDKKRQGEKLIEAVKKFLG